MRLANAGEPPAPATPRFGAIRGHLAVSGTDIVQAWHRVDRMQTVKQIVRKKQAISQTR
ncbi:hypothetical protein [Cupriavidus basilensis]